MMATTKDELIELVRRSRWGDSAAEVLGSVRSLGSEEDQPLTEEERSEVERAEAEVASGDYVTLGSLEMPVDR